MIELLPTYVCMVAYFCHNLSENHVDLSGLYVILSDIYVDLSIIHYNYSYNFINIVYICICIGPLWNKLKMNDDRVALSIAIYVQQNDACHKIIHNLTLPLLSFFMLNRTKRFHYKHALARESLPQGTWNLQFWQTRPWSSWSFIESVCLIYAREQRRKRHCD